MSTKDKNKRLQAEVTVESSPEIKEHFDEWGYLYTEISRLYQSGCKEITEAELFDMLNLDPSKEREASLYLSKTMRLQSRWSAGRKILIFPDRVFTREREKVLV